MPSSDVAFLESLYSAVAHVRFGLGQWSSSNVLTGMPSDILTNSAMAPSLSFDKTKCSLPTCSIVSAALDHTIFPL